jgi:hypothetical protein
MQLVPLHPGVSVKSADGQQTTLKGYRNGWHAVRSIVVGICTLNQVDP